MTKAMTRDLYHRARLDPVLRVKLWVQERWASLAADASGL